MKNIYKYLLLVLPILFLASCDRGENPDYATLDVDVDWVEINLAKGGEPQKKEITITSDNGDYKLFYVNKENETQMKIDTSRVDVKVDVKRILFVGKKRGVVDFKLSDWANKEKIISVYVKEDVDLVLEKNSLSTRVGNIARTTVYDGNGGYTIESLKPEIATATVSEPEIGEQEKNHSSFLIKGEIEIMALAVGQAEFKIKDVNGHEQILKVNVSEALVPMGFIGINPNEKVDVVIGAPEPTVIKFTGGNGGYTATGGTASSIEYTLDEDTKTLIIKGKTRVGVTIIIKDKEGQEIKVDLLMDYPFLDNSTVRMKRNNVFETMYTNRTINYDARLKSTRILISSSILGVGLEFKGDLSIGKKTDGRTYKLGMAGETAGTSIALTACEIVKVENNTYWITFVEEGTGYKGYLVVTPN